MSFPDCPCRSIGVPPGNAPPAGSSAQAEAASGAISPELLAGILAGMADQVGQPQQQLPSLAEVLTPQNLVPLLDDETVQRRLGELVEHLPLEHQSIAANQVCLPATLSNRHGLLNEELPFKQTLDVACAGSSGCRRGSTQCAPTEPDPHPEPCARLRPTRFFTAGSRAVGGSAWCCMYAYPVQSSFGFSRPLLTMQGYSAADFLQSIQNQADQQKHKEDKK